MPKQFDIFVDEYQSAEGTNQEFDIYIDKTVGKNLFNPVIYEGITYNKAVGTKFTPSVSSAQFIPGSDGRTYTAYSASSWPAYSIIIPITDDIKTFRMSISARGLRTTVYFLDSEFTVISKTYSTSSSRTITSTLSNSSGAAYYAVYFSTNTTKVTFTITDPQLEYGSSATAYESYIGLHRSFDICVCNPIGADINMGDITIYSLPFRTTTRVNSELILSVPNDAVRNYVEQKAKIDSSFLLGTDIDTRIEQVTKVASDMVISAIEKRSIEVNSGMVIDVSIGGTTLWRYRLLSDMDDSKLSVYDNMTLGDTDIVVL